MFKALLHIIATAGALLLIAEFVPGISIASFTTAVIVAIVWGFIGLTIKPILGLLTLPINLITLGLFSFILNALLFWLMASVVPGFEVAGFLPALEGSVLLMVVSWVVNAIL
jgi:putative membrane protein